MNLTNQIENDSSINDLISQSLDYYNSHLLFYKPHPKQLLFHQAGKEAKERLLCGGNRMGKTLAACAEGTLHLTGNYPDSWEGYRYKEPINMWAASVSRQAARDFLQGRYIGDINTGKPGLIVPSLIINKTYSAGVSGAIDTVVVQHKSGGVSTLSFKSYDQGREKFQGTEKHIIHLDEEPPRNIYIECLMRTMATRPGFHGMVMLVMSPLLGTTEMILHFTHRNENEKRKVELVQDSKFYVIGSLEENPYVPPEEKEAFIATLMPHEIEARIKGIPTLGSGLVYPVSESVLTCDPFEIPEYWGRVFALDFGWEHPTAAVFFAHDRDNDMVYAYGEYGASHLTPQHHAIELMKQGADWMPGVYDPAGKISSQKDGSKLVNLYREAGIRNLSAANNSREVGIQTVLQRMQRGKFKIFKTLNKTLTQLRMYCRHDGIIKDGNDDFMDCIRYGIMSGIALAHPRNISKWQIPMQSTPGGWMARV